MRLSALWRGVNSKEGYRLPTKNQRSTTRSDEPSKETQKRFDPREFSRERAACSSAFSWFQRRRRARDTCCSGSISGHQRENRIGEIELRFRSMIPAPASCPSAPSPAPRRAVPPPRCTSHARSSPPCPLPIRWIAFVFVRDRQGQGSPFRRAACNLFTLFPPSVRVVAVTDSCTGNKLRSF